MRRLLFPFVLFLFIALSVSAQEREVKLKIIQTSDIHGNFYPFNFLTQKEHAGSLARVHALVEKEREQYKDNLILLDNGDILQGQPTVYYYNYIDTVSPHVCAAMMNYMGYDAGNMGNHDVEAGRPVFERWINECRFPVLGANIIDTATEKPYMKPYLMFEREGVRIAVLGMITPAIPAWLPENLWRGLRFDDMEETAKHWVEVIRREERPDIIVGLFHAGQNSFKMSGLYNENASLDIAMRVPGFDIVLMGHDHARECKKVVNVAGDSVWIVNPANNGLVVGDIDLTVQMKDGRVQSKQIEGRLTETKGYGVSEAFMAEFASQYETVSRFVSKKVGIFTKGVSGRQAFFGPSAFIDLIHTLQLEISGADISFAAPLSSNAEIKEGDVHVWDMFNLYKYENLLYVMELSGHEIKGVLEESYDLWTNRMQSPDDHLLLLKAESRKKEGDEERVTFQNMSFNFDSAAGIVYTVDVTKPKGEKITIISMADGTPFHPDKMYRVAVNSYRGNGGGELLTKGAGIAQEKLKNRIVYTTDKDLRYYLMTYIEKAGVITPRRLDAWKFIPEEWVVPAAARDYELIFGHLKKE